MRRAHEAADPRIIWVRFMTRKARVRHEAQPVCPALGRRRPSGSLPASVLPRRGAVGGRSVERPDPAVAPSAAVAGVVRGFRLVRRRLLARPSSIRHESSRLEQVIDGAADRRLRLPADSGALHPDSVGSGVRAGETRIIEASRPKRR